MTTWHKHVSKSCASAQICSFKNNHTAPCRARGHARACTQVPARPCPVYNSTSLNRPFATCEPGPRPRLRGPTRREGACELSPLVVRLPRCTRCRGKIPSHPFAPLLERLLGPLVPQLPRLRGHVRSWSWSLPVRARAGAARALCVSCRQPSGCAQALSASLQWCRQAFATALRLKAYIR